MNDTNETWAILNAFALRDIIRGLGYEFYRQEGAFGKSHSSYAITLLEELERKNRIREHFLLHQDDSSKHLMDVVANNLAKFNFNTRQAAHFVNDFASKLGSATLQAASSFSDKTKEFAQITVSKVQSVAGDLSNFASSMYLLALEEQERIRRMNDPMEIYAIQNAWNQSQIIRNLEYFYKPERTFRLARFPTSYLEELERRQRIGFDNKETKLRAKAVADLVQLNITKFERAHEYAVELMRKREVASHSRMNPKAAPFVPLHTVQFEKKVEAAPIARSNIASGAQL